MTRRGQTVRIEIYNYINLYKRSILFVIFICTLVGRSISSDKDESSFVTTCSTFVNPESSITDTHFPQTNASTRIRLYFDILSNVIQKRDLPKRTDPFHYIRVIITLQLQPARLQDVRLAHGMENMKHSSCLHVHRTLQMLVHHRAHHRYLCEVSDERHDRSLLPS